MPQIQIPSPLRQYSGKQASVDVPGKTVGEALAGLVAQHPDLKRHLYTDDGKLRAFVNVYVNDEDMRYLQKEATALKDGDTISIVPSIAGGCCPGVTDSSGLEPSSLLALSATAGAAPFQGRRRRSILFNRDFMAPLSDLKPSEAVLSNDEILRYSRHLIMPEVGMEGSKSLRRQKSSA